MSSIGGRYTDGYGTVRDSGASPAKLHELAGQAAILATAHPDVKGSRVPHHAAAEARAAAAVPHEDSYIHEDASRCDFTQAKGPNFIAVRYSEAVTRGDALYAGAVLSAAEAIRDINAGKPVFAEKGRTTKGRWGAVGFQPEGGSSGTCAVLAGGAGAVRSFLREHEFDPR